MRDSWITKKLQNAGRKTVLPINLLKISILAKKTEKPRLEKQDQEKIILQKHDLVLILVVILILILIVYITYKTGGALESTRYYNIK